MVKLSETQQGVLDKMQNGWELGCSSIDYGRCWIQEGGIGRGGQVKTVSHSTVYALSKKGLIKQERKWNFPTIRYELVSK